jgi:hypothetical protein
VHTLCSVIGPSKEVAGYDGCPSRLRGRAGIDVISPQGGESGDIEKLLLNIAALDGKRICIIPQSTARSGCICQYRKDCHRSGRMQ